MKRTAKAERFVVAVGERVRTLRKAKDLGQEDLARKLDTYVPVISLIESGKRDMRASQLFEVARALGTTPADLVSVVVNGNGSR